MDLESRLRSSQNHQGERKFRCGVCGKWIRLSQAHTDFVHKNCSTKWRISGHDRKSVFKMDLLASGKSMLSGMLTEPPDNPKRKNKTIDKSVTDDCYTDLK